MSIFSNRFSKKQKRTIIFCGITAGVYLAFRFLLPPALPFLIAYWIACLFEPIVQWMNRKWRLPKMLSTVVLMLCLGGTLLLAGYFLVRKLLEQAGKLVDRIPQYEEAFDVWMNQVSEKGESILHLQKDQLLSQMWEWLQNGLNAIQESIMPYVIEHSGSIMARFIGFTTILVLIQVAILLCMKEMDNIRHVCEHSLFAKEIQVIKEPVRRVGKAYLRSQSIILVVVICELMFGLSLMGNEYSLILGLLIGILDALPLFGTGTVLIPWILILLVAGRFWKAAEVAVLYLTCYFTREILDPKLMGKGTGMTPLETLIAIYAGLKLFGIWGLFLGPIAWLLVKEIDKAYDFE